MSIAFPLAVPANHPFAIDDGKALPLPGQQVIHLRNGGEEDLYYLPWLAGWRESEKMSVTRLSDHSDVFRSTIQRLERLREPARLGTVGKLARALRMSNRMLVVSPAWVWRFEGWNDWMSIRWIDRNVDTPRPGDECAVKWGYTRTCSVCKQPLGWGLGLHCYIADEPNPRKRRQWRCLEHGVARVEFKLWQGA